jgi:hypothetical protein
MTTHFARVLGILIGGLRHRRIVPIHLEGRDADEKTVHDLTHRACEGKVTHKNKIKTSTMSRFVTSYLIMSIEKASYIRATST